MKNQNTEFTFAMRTYFRIFFKLVKMFIDSLLKHNTHFHYPGQTIVVLFRSFLIF